MPPVSRLPYMAPEIETHLVELEGGIASGSARLAGRTAGNFTVEDYADGGSANVEDIELN